MNETVAGVLVDMYPSRMKVDEKWYPFSIVMIDSVVKED